MWVEVQLLPPPGMNQRKRHAAVFAVDRKIRIERKHVVPVVDFGHADDAGIGQRHRIIRSAASRVMSVCASNNGQITGAAPIGMRHKSVPYSGSGYAHLHATDAGELGNGNVARV